MDTKIRPASLGAEVRASAVLFAMTVVVGGVGVVLANMLSRLAG